MEREDRDAALARFVSSRDVATAREAILALQKGNALATAARDPVFVHGLEALADLSGAGPDETRLEALALLFRIRAVARARRLEIEALASKATDPLETSPQVLADPDDRRYVGDALAHVRGDWKRNYLANAVVEEVSGDKARAAFATALLAEAANVAEALAVLGSAFERWSVGTQDVGASRARRLVRVVTALREAIVELDPPPGEDAGTELLAFARAALGGEQVELDLQTQVAAALLSVLSTLVRFHFSLASNVETFAVLHWLRQWFRRRGWPADLEEERRTVAQQVEEALIFLAKQGIVDDGLRRTLHAALNDGEADSELKRIAHGVPGIPGEVRSWLLTGSRRAAMATAAAVDETVLRTVDRDIANLLRDASELQATLDRIEDDLPAVFEAYEPKLAPTAERLASIARRIGQRITALAARRSLRFGGRAGDLAEFNPVDHETPADGSASRVVRLRVPSVQRAVAGAPPDVILRAEVEGVDER